MTPIRSLSAVCCHLNLSGDSLSYPHPLLQKVHHDTGVENDHNEIMCIRSFNDIN